MNIIKLAATLLLSLFLAYFVGYYIKPATAERLQEVHKLSISMNSQEAEKFFIHSLRENESPANITVNNWVSEINRLNAVKFSKELQNSQNQRAASSVTYTVDSISDGYSIADRIIIGFALVLMIPYVVLISLRK